MAATAGQRSYTYFFSASRTLDALTACPASNPKQQKEKAKQNTQERKGESNPNTKTAVRWTWVKTVEPVLGEVRAKAQVEGTHVNLLVDLRGRDASAKGEDLAANLIVDGLRACSTQRQKGRRGVQHGKGSESESERDGGCKAAEKKSANARHPRPQPTAASPFKSRGTYCRQRR